MSKNISLMNFCYFKDSIVSKDKACISLASQSLQYGSLCFSGIRGYIRMGNVRIFRLKDHHMRLMNAAKIMGLKFHIPYEKFEQIISSMVDQNAPTTDFYIRAFLFSENEVVDVCYDHLQFSLAIYMMPLNLFYQGDKGLRLTISSWQKITDSAMPTKAKEAGCYVNSSLATTDARRAHYDEALLMDHNQNIVESSIANLFVVYRGEVFTPPVGADALEGITWRTVVELLSEKGYKVRYEPISRSMVYTCDELFLTGTAAQVVFAESVDGRIIGDGKEGKVTKAVKGWYQDLIDMKHPKSKEYITEYAKAYQNF